MIKIDHLVTIDPLSENQKLAFKAWKKDDHNLVLSGCAGTGKTFIALYLALEQVLDKGTPYESVHVVRSIVPTRDVGFLPGSIEEKMEPYQLPYIPMCRELIDVISSDGYPYGTLIDQGSLRFLSTSHIRGLTLNNTVIIVEEMQNLTFHELDSIITRVGLNTKIIFCGDYHQSDLKKEGDRNGLLEFLEILEELNYFSTINFTWKDICRSDFVRDYIMTREMKLRP